MIDKKIFREIGEILDELVKQAGSHYNGWEPKEGWMTSPMAYEKIKSLFKEYAMEIIGKDEDPTIYGVWNPLSAKGVKIEKKIMDDKDTLVRNKLRAEQREKVGKI